MDTIYEYGKLEDKLLRLCRAGEPDFPKIEAVINAGANINAVNKSGECMLHRIYHNCQSHGNHLPEITNIFIRSGFHMQKYGRACLSGLVFSSYDRYIVDTAKIILKAGAQLDEDGRKTVLNSIGTEESYQRCCDKNHACENIFYAFYELVDRATSGRHYLDLVPWQDCVGKTVKSIFADAKATPVLEGKPGGKYAFFGRLYFDCGDSVVMIESNPNIYGCSLPNEERDDPLCLNDTFPNLLGAVITKIKFRHNEYRIETTEYRQPVISVCFDNGQIFRFTTNFGEVPKGFEFNYFEVIE